ncbi:MAG: GNAT family protein [Phycisphaeraceae bacterium]
MPARKIAVKVFLRALEMPDLERTHQWHNDPELYRTLLGNFQYVSKAVEEQWLKNAQAFSSTQINLAICLTRTGEHIGNIYLRDIDWRARRGEVGIFIAAPMNHGKGYGEQALRLLIRHAADDLGLQRLHLTVLEEHAAAVHLYRKLGFDVEGCLRRHAFKNGQWCNVLFMGLLLPATTGKGKA